MRSFCHVAVMLPRVPTYHYLLTLISGCVVKLGCCTHTCSEFVFLVCYTKPPDQTWFMECYCVATVQCSRVWFFHEQAILDIYANGKSLIGVLSCCARICNLAVFLIFSDPNSWPCHCTIFSVVLLPKLDPCWSVLDYNSVLHLCVDS